MDKFSYLGNGDVNAVEDIYQQYLKDNLSVDESWQQFFKGFEFARSNYDEPGGAIPENLNKEFKVINLITGYR
ncbi:MAG TPA: hypothetical protein VNX68_09020 [Nitrosopumilaceae archaeon]|nr:hypothetical protein [Nitrosopumilaceae archaeon]